MSILDEADELRARIKEGDRALGDYAELLAFAWEAANVPEGLGHARRASLAEVIRAARRDAEAETETLRADSVRYLQRITRYEQEMGKLQDQVENLLHRMTSEEAATEIERLRAPRGT